MRLIDADALMQEIMKARASLQMLDNTQNADKMLQGLRMVEILVENAPTIEPKRGKWIWQSSMAGSFIERRYRCSNCQYEITTQREEPIYNYCPNCGARMKGTDDE